MKCFMKDEVYEDRCALETKDLIIRKAELEDWELMYRNVWSRAETSKYVSVCVIRITKYLASFTTLFYTELQI